MRHRLAILALSAALAAGLVPAPQARAEPGSWTEPPPDKLPRVARGDRIKNLDFLFEALKAAPDADAAKLVEGRIWALWLASGSDTADLLMSRVKTAQDAKDSKLAVELLDAVLESSLTMSKAGTGAPPSISPTRSSASRLPICVRCWRANRAISARSPGSASSCRSSARTSSRSKPSARRSPSIRTCRRCRTS